MKITTVLFDLDGTLLPMDNDEFTKGYFKLLAAKLAPYGYEPKKLVDAIWAGTAAMVKNNGSQTNEEAFWKRFSEIYGKKGMEDQPLFEEFYRNEFQSARKLCKMNPKSPLTVHAAKEIGFRVALATNPLFPAPATESRIRWAGLDPEEFELYTTYEGIGFCKPNPEYYLEITRRLKVYPEECLMVGNDVKEDMIAESLGMKVFLLTDCLINREGQDISRYRHGSFDCLSEYFADLAE